MRTFVSRKESTVLQPLKLQQCTPSNGDKNHTLINEEITMMKTMKSVYLTSL